MDSIDELDCSWITEEESNYSGNLNCISLNSIQCKFVYLGLDNSILKVETEEEILTDIPTSTSTTNKGILNERILQLIQNKRFLDSGQRYKMMSLVKFLVDIPPEQLSDFHKCDIDSLHSLPFLKEISFLGNVIIEPSLFFFHSLVTLYFFLKVDEMMVRPMRSILKSGNHSITKKVRILEDLPTMDIKTRKNRA